MKVRGHASHMHGAQASRRVIEGVGACLPHAWCASLPCLSHPGGCNSLFGCVCLYVLISILDECSSFLKLLVGCAKPFCHSPLREAKGSMTLTATMTPASRREPLCVREKMCPLTAPLFIASECAQDANRKGEQKQPQ